MGLLADIFGENYRYHDTPDGEDCFDKLFFVTKYTAVYGVLWSSVDVTLISHPVGYGATLARYAYLTIPAVGATGAWAAAVCAATNIRKKDDRWNYAIGGLASGAVVGAWRKRVKVGCYSALAFAFLSVIYKDHLIKGWTFMDSKSKPKHQTLWSINRDFSLTSDPPKTWTTEAPQNSQK